MSRPKNKNGRTKVLNAYRNNKKATLQSIAAKAGMTINAVYYHLCNLRKDGVITFVPYPRGRRKDQAQAGGDTFTPKKSKKDTDLQKRIDDLVADVKYKQALGIDVDPGVSIFDRRHIHSIRGSKAG